jgi:hypothetical protein
MRSCSTHISSRIAALSIFDIFFVAFPKSSVRVTTCMWWPLTPRQPPDAHAHCVLTRRNEPYRLKGES